MCILWAPMSYAHPEKRSCPWLCVAKIQDFYCDFYQIPVVPLRSLKIEFRILAWNFAHIKVSVRIVYGESFNTFGCSFLELWILKYWLFYTNYALFLKKGTTKSVETFTISYFHWDLYVCKVSSQNSKLNFFVTWGEPQGFDKNLSKSPVSLQHKAMSTNVFQDVHNS